MSLTVTKVVSNVLTVVNARGRHFMVKRPAPRAARSFLEKGTLLRGVWTDRNRRIIRTERFQAIAMGLAWVLAGMLVVTLLLTIVRYAIVRAAEAATLAPSMMMFWPRRACARSRVE